jgi:hypothetical protein
MPKFVEVGCSSDPSETSLTVDISRTSRANIVQRQTEPRTPSWPNLHEGRSQPSYRYAQLDTRLSLTGALRSGVFPRWKNPVVQLVIFEGTPMVCQTVARMF